MGARNGQTLSASSDGSGEISPVQGLARDLRGDLPCGRCGYNLRGLTVRGNCPECGLPIPATLLAVVDPKAKELQPITFPLATAAGLLVWSVTGVVAAVCVWLLRSEDVARVFGFGGWRTAWAEAWLARVLAACVVTSGIGAVAFVRPHARIPTRQVVAALIGVLCYGPLAWVTWRLHGVLDTAQSSVYFGAGAGNTPTERTALRLVSGSLIALIALCLRPNGRLFVARSMLMRTGRIDRQTFLALAASAGVAGTGDLLRLVSAYLPEGANELMRLCGSLVVGLGSLLLTIGLVNLLIDSLRIRPVVVSAPLSLDEALGHHPAAGNGE